MAIQQGKGSRGNPVMDMKSFQDKLEGLGGPVAKEHESWGDTNAQTLAEAVTNVVDQDGLIGFSRVSGGNALCIYVKWGKSSAKVYAASVQELDDALEDIARRFKA